MEKSSNLFITNLLLLQRTSKRSYPAAAPHYRSHLV